MDSIKKASSGHMGLPLGCAEIGAVLFGQEMCASPLLARASLLLALHARLANLFQPRSQLPCSPPPLLDGPSPCVRRYPRKAPKAIASIPLSGPKTGAKGVREPQTITARRLDMLYAPIMLPPHTRMV